jgi:uncharacterized membrane protein
MHRLVAALAAPRRVAAVVAGVLVVAGAALYPSLPARMVVHWNAAGVPDRTAAKPVAVLTIPALVVLLGLLFEVTTDDPAERVVGSAAMALLLVVGSMVFAVNLGVDVPVVPVTLALALGVVALAVWAETR